MVQTRSSKPKETAEAATSTPQKRKAPSPPIASSGEEKSDEDERLSPNKKPKKKAMKDKIPSRTALKKLETARKKEWKEEWGRWVADSQWKKDDSYRQKLGSEEIHGGEGMFILRTVYKAFSPLFYA